jgi:hypothetical protein
MPRNYFKLLPDYHRCAATAKEWRDWDLELQEKYPLRWKLNEAIERTVDVCFRHPKWKWERFYWKMMHTYHPKHRYHVVVCDSLGPGYHDPAELILHAPFDVFAKFMKHQLDGKGYIQWEFGESDLQHMSQEEIDRRNKEWELMNELYRWWVYERPVREDVWCDENRPPERPPEEWGIMAMLNDDFHDEPVIVAQREYYDRLRDKQQEWKANDTDMLKALIDIRETIWYA